MDDSGYGASPQPYVDQHLALWTSLPSRVSHTDIQFYKAFMELRDRHHPTLACQYDFVIQPCSIRRLSASDHLFHSLIIRNYHFIRDFLADPLGFTGRCGGGLMVAIHPNQFAPCQGWLVSFIMEAQAGDSRTGQHFPCSTHCPLGYFGTCVSTTPPGNSTQSWNKSNAFPIAKYSLIDREDVFLG